MSKPFSLIGLLILTVVLAACSGSSESTPEATIAPTDVPATEEVAVVTEEPTPTQEALEVEASAGQDAGQTEEPIGEAAPATEQVAAADAEPASAAVEYVGGEWTNVAFTNADTGETFTFADFAGKTVFVHPMATWCSVCRASQQSLRSNVVPNVNSDEVVFVSLSVETNLDNEDLAVYAMNNEFTWTFAVLTSESLAALVTEFGGTITNSPAAPHFIINPDGSHDGLRTGVSSPDTLINLLSGA